METEYFEEVIEPGQNELQDQLEQLAGGKPWVLIVADHAGDGLGLKVNCGGGIASAEMLNHLLWLALGGVQARPGDDT